jgi:hypothetical protein
MDKSSQYKKIRKVYLDNFETYERNVTLTIHRLSFNALIFIPPVELKHVSKPAQKQ